MRRVIAARENGRQGGLARARNFDEDILSLMASTGGKAVLEKYGREYFVQLRKRRMHYHKRNEPGPLVMSPTAVASQQNGKLGGIARARLHTPEERQVWARRGGVAARERYGVEFYSRIRKLRTRYPVGHLTQRTKEHLAQQTQALMKEILARAFR